MNTIFIGVKSPDLAENAIKEIKDENIHIILGDKVRSFSELINNCIKLCKTPIFIFCGHKVRPTKSDIKRICDMINDGYGYVGLHKFGCFGIHMDIIKYIGYFDENFIGGGFEDDDFRIRLMQHNIGFYEDWSVKVVPGPSSWGSKYNPTYFDKKYRFDFHQKIIYKFIRDNINMDIDISRFHKNDKTRFVKGGDTFSIFLDTSFKIIENVIN